LLLVLAALPAAPPAAGQTPAGCLTHSPAPTGTVATGAEGVGLVAYQQFSTSWAGAAEPDLETAWFVTYDHPDGTSAETQALYLTSAWFKPGPNEPFVQVLGWTGLSNLYARYAIGFDFFDLGPNSDGLDLVNPRDTGPCGLTTGRGGLVVREVLDKGVLWKSGQDVVRGQMMALWATLNASNYNYIVRYEFHDDGTVRALTGATAQNYPTRRTMAHTHIPLWRIDLDLGGAGGDSARVLRHEQTAGEASWSNTNEAFNGGKEGAMDFEPTEFTQLQVADGSTVYDLRPLWRGVARHPPLWTRNDLWVTVAKPGETDFASLSSYAANQEDVSDADVVVWLASPLLHVPRPEDGVFGGPRGVALAMWSGFDLRPRDLFDQTPFHPAVAPSDPSVEVSFGSASYEVTEGGTVDIVVQLNRDPERSLEIDLVRTHRGAAADDYSGVPFNVRFEPGVTSHQFTVEVTADNEAETGEAVELSFAALPQRVTGAGGTTLNLRDPQ